MQRRLLLTALGGATLFAGAAHAQPAWPSAKPITIIVPFTAGGSVDTTARLKVLKTEEPGGRKAGIKVKSVAELVDKLKNEAGVL